MGAPDSATTTAGGLGQQNNQQGAPLLMGIDLSTQSITAVLIEKGTHKLVAIDSLNFDQVIANGSSWIDMPGSWMPIEEKRLDLTRGFRLTRNGLLLHAQELPKYGTVNGMHVSGKHGKVTQPVAMWLEVRARHAGGASYQSERHTYMYPHTHLYNTHLSNPHLNQPTQGLDKLLRRLDKGLLARVAAVSGSAQQHGSVFWGADGLAALRSMNPADSLLQNLYDGFALADCPIWADSSTQAECDAIETAVGGPAAVAAVTGSRCYARFTGPQIKKIARTQPLVWQHTARVSLVSSFLTSLLLGGYTPSRPVGWIRPTFDMLPPTDNQGSHTTHPNTQQQAALRPSTPRTARG